LDAMRSTLMMLGVVLHSVNVYDSKKDWQIYSENTTIIADYISELIHVFRMPTFFVISGFFCIFTLYRYQPKKFLMIRLKRIIIPLIVTGITLNTLQVMILSNTKFYQFELWNYVSQGHWLSHLWFLVNLIVYFLIAATLSKFISSIIKIIGRKLQIVFLSMPIILITFFMPLLSIVILGLNKAGFPLFSNYLGVFYIYDLLIYTPYFIFGAVLASNFELLHRFSKINPLSITFILIIAILVNKYILLTQFGIEFIFSVYIDSLIIWQSIALCFYVFYKFCNTPSRIWSFLSDASYTVYIFHHLFVVTIGIILVYYSTPPIIGIFLLITLTTITTLLIHYHVILKFKYAQLLFNGK